MKSATFTTKVSVPHLLLHEHLLDTDARIVDSVDLPADWSTLIAASYGPNTGRPIMNIIFSADTTSGPATPTFLSLTHQTAWVLMRQILAALVPHKVSEAVPGNKLCIRSTLIRADHIELLTRRRAFSRFFQKFEFTGDRGSRHAR